MLSARMQYVLALTSFLLALPLILSAQTAPGSDTDQGKQKSVYDGGSIDKQRLYEDALRFEKAGQYLSAISLYSELLSRGPYLDASDRQAHLARKLKNQERLVRFRKHYAAGQTAFKNQNYHAALLHFEHAVAAQPASRHARRKLKQVREIILAEDIERQIEDDFAFGITALHSGEPEQALGFFNEIRKKRPAYPNIEDYIAEAQEKLERPAEEMPAVPVRQQATLAEETEEQQTAFAPVTLAEVKPAGNHRRLLAFGGISLALMLVPALLFMYRYPPIQARLHLMRGELLAAARIYESEIYRNPGQKRFYPPLAAIYLKQGRVDKEALALYQIILKMKLKTPFAEQMEGILTRKALPSPANRSLDDLQAQLESFRMLNS